MLRLTTNLLKPKPLITALIFPGQGTQSPGKMLPDSVKSLPNFNEVMDSSNRIMGYDIHSLMEGGEVKKRGSDKFYNLNDTEVSQPAIFISTALAFQAARKEFEEYETPIDLNNCVFAGYSLGEYAALYASGKLEFPDALTMTLFRGLAMQRDCKNRKTKLYTLITRGAAHASIKTALQECRQNEDEILQVSAHLAPNIYTVGGDDRAMTELVARKREFGVLAAKPVPVSGAFHTNSMKDAAFSFSMTLKKMNGSFKENSRVCYSNVTGNAYSDIKEIKYLLPVQIRTQVKWHQIVSNLAKMDDIERVIEIGPGEGQLGKLLKMTDGKLHQKYSYAF